MAQNYIIKINNTKTFGGWNILGEIIINNEDKSNLAYRMSRTLAIRTIPKIEEFLNKKGIVNSDLEISKVTT